MQTITNIFTKVKAFWTNNALASSTFKQVALLAIALLAIIPLWDATQVVIYFIGVMGLVGMGVHLIRRIFFPRILIDSHAAEALKGNVAAAIVVASMVFFMCTLFVVAALMVGLK